MTDPSDEVVELRRELEETNRGLIALYAELEAARQVEARLAAARTAHEVLATRERFARDLQEGAVQAVFAASMRLQATATMSDGALRRRMEEVVHQLDRVIEDLRRQAFGVQTHR